MSADEILTSSDSGVVRTLTWHRPQQYNALTIEVAEELHAAISKAERSEHIRAIVLTGIGEHFSSGGDARSIIGAINESDDAIAHLMHSFHELIKSIWNSPLPVIAAVQGIAYGGGFNLALACDMIVCSSNSRFCQVFIKRGLVPDLGGAFLLPRLVGLQRAKELMFLAPEIDAQRAFELGIINEIVADGDDVQARAIEVATAVAQHSPRAIALSKSLINTSVGDLSASLNMEAAVQAVALSTPQVREGFERFL
jgi:2-(1,2-epoxy-1,2-dihydrophenyl)acetyl-CoA isomerase